MKKPRIRHSKWFKRIPTQESIRAYRFLKPISRFLDHHRLWQFNRRSVAGGAAVGLFFSMATPFAQIPCAVIAAILLRVNLPVAVFGTLFSNPFTTPALLFVAYKLGAFILGEQAQAQVQEAVVASSNKAFNEGFLQLALGWIVKSFEWLQAAGPPLLLGLAILSLLLAAFGYFAVMAAWRLHAVVHWRRRSDRRQNRRAE
jgi:uncharacterized protein (DUF2062 family)